MENEMNLPAAEKMQVSIPQQEMLSLYASASTLVLTSEENQKMLELFTDDEIEIRPDGHIYIPQALYRNRLNQVLGIGQWNLIPKSFTQDPNQAANKWFMNGFLVIRKCLVAEAVGEAELRDNNSQQSMATIWEAAKSDCITRCCKDLSIGQQSSSPAFTRKWQEKYAIKVWVKDKKSPMWRKRTSPPFRDELGEVDAKKPFPFQHPTNTRNWLNKVYKSGGTTAEWSAAIQGLQDGTLSLGQLNEQYKISKELTLELEQIIKEASNKVGQIPGEIYAKLEKCKTKLDVDQLSLNYMEQIKANENWRNVFMSAKTKLPAATTTKA